MVEHAARDLVGGQPEIIVGVLGRSADAEPVEADAEAVQARVAFPPVRAAGFDRDAQDLLVADVGQAGAKPATFAVGYVLIDREGRVAGSFAEKRTLSPSGSGGTWSANSMKWVHFSADSEDSTPLFARIATGRTWIWAKAQTKVVP